MGGCGGAELLAAPLPPPSTAGVGVPLPSRHLQRLRARRVHQGGLGNLEGPMVQRGKKGLEKEKDGCEDPNDEFRPTPPPHMGSHHCGLPYIYGEGVLRPALTQPVPTPTTKGTHTKGSLGGLGPKTEPRRMRRYSQEHQEGRGDHGVLQGPGGGDKETELSVCHPLPHPRPIAASAHPHPIPTPPMSALPPHFCPQRHPTPTPAPSPYCPVDAPLAPPHLSPQHLLQSPLSLFYCCLTDIPTAAPLMSPSPAHPFPLPPHPCPIAAPLLSLLLPITHPHHHSILVPLVPTLISVPITTPSCPHCHPILVCNPTLLMSPLLPNPFPHHHPIAVPITTPCCPHCRPIPAPIPTLSMPPLLPNPFPYHHPMAVPIATLSQS